MIQRYIAPKIKEHLASHNILLLLGTRGVQKFELVVSCIEQPETILEIDASKKKIRKEIEALKSNGYLSSQSNNFSAFHDFSLQNHGQIMSQFVLSTFSRKI